MLNCIARLSDKDFVEAYEAQHWEKYTGYTRQVLHSAYEDENRWRNSPAYEQHKARYKTLINAERHWKLKADEIEQRQ